MNIFNELKQYGEWQVKSRRTFNEEELACFTSAVCIASQWGKSVCFMLKTGYKAYIPLTDGSTLSIGQEVNPAKCEVLKLGKPGEDDINRIEYMD